MYLPGGNINHINTELLLCSGTKRKKKNRDAESFIADTDGERRYIYIFFNLMALSMRNGDGAANFACAVCMLIHAQPYTKLMIRR